MKILFAPSEGKTSGGDKDFNINDLYFKTLNPKQKELINLYNNTTSNSSIKELSKLFGIKKENEIKEYTKDILKEPTLKAIKRYSGVSFDYLNYNSLKPKSQKYLDNNLIIFSNLFGILKADDLIPNYKLKQAEALKNIKINEFYKESIKEILDKYLENQDILDLRASYYNKFYIPKSKYLTLKFIKNDKVVSHWAKAYRGKVLREIAKYEIKSIEEFLKLDIENLKVKEIKSIKNRDEIVFEILDK